ncbi:hypothetical protein [Mesorhizobium sp. ZC-5]|uniref:hypothetical protein n=1 Tax=Mesorhizobium sp. ZC-5 TaxID=2986066 RepID=UPI0021E92908|nr:hypothetical protein [Mesorhizobium sp. ZC-5]MCV3241777.1 hypothetical protein [Mesorhizobium sp. ZC-5]
MGPFENIDVLQVVRICARGGSNRKVISTSQAVEELRVLSGDFVSTDGDMANEILKAAVCLGYAVVLDERAGADTLNYANLQIASR